MPNAEQMRTAATPLMSLCIETPRADANHPEQVVIQRQDEVGHLDIDQTA